MGTKSKWEILNDPAILRAIKGGVCAGLLGSGWNLNQDLVKEMVSEVKVLLAESYLDKYDPNRGKTLPGYVRMVARSKTLNFVQLKLHQNDGAVNAMRIDGTDATADDASPRVVEDECAGIGFLRVEQRERLTRAMARLEAIERSHIEALLAGETSAQWAARNGMTPVQATRHKQAIVAKLARFVAEDE